MNKLFALLLVLVLATVAQPFSFAEEALPEITYLRWDASNYTDEQWAAVEEQIGAKVNVQVVPFDDYYSKLNTLIAANSAPDVFQISEYLAIEWGEKGMSMDLNKAFQDKGVNLEDTYVAACLYGTDDKVYGITSGLTSIMLFYNKALFDKYDVPYPSSDPENPISWAEYVKTAQLLTRDSAGLCPLDDGFNASDIVCYGTLSTTWTFSLTAFLYSNGAGFFSPDGMSLALGTDEAQEVLTEMAKLSSEYKCAPDAVIGASLPGHVQMFKDGMLGMAVEGSFMIGSYVNEGADFGISPLPVFIEPATATWSAAHAIAQTTEHPDEALKLLEVISADTGSQYPSLIADYEGDNYQNWANKLGLSDSDRTWMADYINSSASKVHEAVFIKNYGTILDEVISPELSKLWSGDATAEEIAAVVSEKAAGMFEGAYNIIAQ